MRRKEMMKSEQSAYIAWVYLVCMPLGLYSFIFHDRLNSSYNVNSCKQTAKKEIPCATHNGIFGLFQHSHWRKLLRYRRTLLLSRSGSHGLLRILFKHFHMMVFSLSLSLAFRPRHSAGIQCNCKRMVFDPFRSSLCIICVACHCCCVRFIAIEREYRIYFTLSLPAAPVCVHVCMCISYSFRRVQNARIIQQKCHLFRVISNPFEQAASDAERITGESKAPLHNRLHVARAFPATHFYQRLRQNITWRIFITRPH